MKQEARSLEEVLQSLGKTPKEIPSKFFYDRNGSDLFERICALPEYYLGRASLGLIERHADDIARCWSGAELLFEYGGASSRKVRPLLARLRNLKVYAPIDVSRDHLLEASRSLSKDFPGLQVVPVCADYLKIGEIAGPWREISGTKVCFFPGSTIGNLTPPEAQALLRRTRDIVAPGGGVLVGVDLKKDQRVLEAAYNDRAGVTAAFNLNVLRRLNAELGADFDLKAFRHKAFYNARLGRIEMHLESLKDQTVRVGGRPISFTRGETIHTENSYKYGIEEFQDLARQAGLRPVRVWTDEKRLFSLHDLEAP